MIVVVDYNLGNIKSVFRAFDSIKVPVKMSSDPSDISKASGVVVPGVGAFRKAMENLESLGLLNSIRKSISSGKPYLGICLGYQILFSNSYEYGNTKGLNILMGTVKEFPGSVKIPHMGWNTVKAKDNIPIFNGIENKSHFYFNHSYYVESDQKLEFAYTNYGSNFPSAVMYKNIYGVQFHPEKSGEKGLEMLRSFSKICLPKE